MKGKRKILLVDDDALLRNVLQRILAHAGYEVIPAGNGREALTQYQLCPADVVLTDIVMPETEGVETIQELRRLNPAVKIIAMSGGGMIDPQSYLSVVRKMGVSATLQKPFTHQEMLDTLQRLLSPDDHSPAAATDLV